MGSGGDDDDGQAGPGPQVPQNLQPVHIRQSQIQNHEIRAVGGDDGLRLFSGPCQHVFLTPRAWDALPEILQAVEEWEKQMLGGITPQEVAQLEHLLQKMAQNVSDV